MSEKNELIEQEPVEQESPDAPEDTDGTEPNGEQDSTDGAESGDAQEPKPKKKLGLGIKIAIIAVAVVVVLAGGGGGFYLAFHDQPWFCNFVCHTPMDPYVVSYEEGTSVNAAQADSGGLLSVTLHKESDQQLDCLSCHVPDMNEQINEGMKWVSGDYELPIEMKMVSGQIKEGSGDKNGVEFCLRPECHEGVTTLEDLKALTADQHRNPHDSHLGNQDCSNCHQTHEQSVIMCTQCHQDVEIPEGWITYKEQQDQKKQLEAS